MNIKTQIFLVLGVSKSGNAVANYLLENNATTYIYEELEIESIKKTCFSLVEKGAILLNKENVQNELSKIDVLVVSPGFPINHPICVKCKELGVRIVGEFEFAFLTFNPTCVAVTGTNGKTTTVSLINHILECAKINSKLVGNVGIPVTSKLGEIDKNTVCVCEVSSYQLETINVFCPHIACMLNVSPDHLERHYTMENYIFLKNKLLFSQTESEFAVLNYDDVNVRNMSEKSRAKVVYVSLAQKVDGAYFLGGDLYYKNNKIINENQLTIKGEHNVYNALFAIAVSVLLGVDLEVIKSALSTFKGVPHRIELVKEVNGVKFYNDSKATNTNSTITAIKYIKEPTILIIGGFDKGENYDLLFNEIKNSNVVHTIITGNSRINMLKSALLNGVTDITVTPDFNLAIKSALTLVKQNQTVLFSPACSSFDNFSNFEERGNAFKKAISEYN